MKRILSILAKGTSDDLTNQYLIFGLIYLFFFSYLLQVKLSGSDDLFIYNLGKEIPLKNAFHMNARISSNFFGALLAKGNLVFWKICTPIILTILVYSLSTIIIGSKELTPRSKVKVYIFVFLSFLYIYPFVFTSSVFWVAGSVSYIWPVSLGVYSFLHFIKTSNNQKIKAWNIFVFYLCSFYAAFGQEQISLILSSFSLLYIIWYYIEKRTLISKYLIIQAIIYLCGTIFLVSPVSEARMLNDINLYYQDFQGLTIFDKIYRGVIWLCNQLFNKDRFLVIIFMILLIIYNSKFTINKIKRSLINILLVIPVTVLILSSVPVEAVLNSLIRDVPHNHKINFDVILKDLVVFDVHKYIFTTPFEYIKFVFWAFYLIAIPFLILFIGKDRSINYWLFIILVASYLSSSVMFFAPSIYESKHRVFLVMDILIVLIIGFLFEKLGFSNSLRKRYLVLYTAYPLLIYFTLHWLWWSGYFIMY